MLLDCCWELCGCLPVLTHRKVHLALGRYFFSLYENSRGAVRHMCVCVGWTSFSCSLSICFCLFFFACSGVDEHSDEWHFGNLSALSPSSLKFPCVDRKSRRQHLTGFQGEAPENSWRGGEGEDERGDALQVIWWRWRSRHWSNFLATFYGNNEIDEGQGEVRTHERRSATLFMIIAQTFITRMPASRVENFFPLPLSFFFLVRSWCTVQVWGSQSHVKKNLLAWFSVKFKVTRQEWFSDGQTENTKKSDYDQLALHTQRTTFENENQLCALFQSASVPNTKLLRCQAQWWADGKFSPLRLSQKPQPNRPRLVFENCITICKKKIEARRCGTESNWLAAESDIMSRALALAQFFLAIFSLPRSTQLFLHCRPPQLFSSTTRHSRALWRFYISSPSTIPVLRRIIKWQTSHRETRRKSQQKTTTRRSEIIIEQSRRRRLFSAANFARHV